MNKTEKINQLITSGYKYNRGCETLIEVIKDQWVFTKDADGEEHMRFIDAVLSEYTEQEKKQKEIEAAAKGSPVVVQYFKKYGVLGERQDRQPKHSLNLFHSTVITDGKYKNAGWNTELSQYSVLVYQDHDINNYIYKPGYVNQIKLSVSHRVDDLVDGQIIDGEPDLRLCHQSEKKLHKVMTNHVKHSDWIQDLNLAFEIFIKHVDSLIEDKPIQLNKKNGFMFQGKNEIFTWKFDNNYNYGWTSCPEITFTRHEIIDMNGVKKYRDGSEFSLYKLPKFDATTTKQELLQNIKEYYFKRIEEYGVTAEFKYS